MPDDTRPPQRARKAAPPKPEDEYSKNPKPYGVDPSNAPPSAPEFSADDGRPRKKKPKLTAAQKRRIRAEMADEDAAERDQEGQEWLLPGILFGVGVILTIAGGAAIGVQQSPRAMMGVLIMVPVSLLYSAIMVPVAVVALMVVGSIAGIEYGSAKNAVRSLAAILVFTNGVYWAGDALGWIGNLFAGGIGLIATYVLFMKFFDLDYNEMWLSVAGINLFSYAVKLAFMLLIAGLLFAGKGKSKPAVPDAADDPDLDDPVPGQVQPNGRR